MTWHTAEDRRDLIRWLACGVVVVFVHGAVAAALIDWSAPIQDVEVGVDDIPVEYQEEQIQTDPVPEVLKVEEKPEPLPELLSEAMLPAEPKPQEQPVPHEVIFQQERVVERAVVSAATWRSQVVTILEHNKRYPAAASARGEQGVTMLAFRVDSDGRLLSSRIIKSSGSTALDQETLALMQRVQPLPPPPPEEAGKELMLPMHYMVR
jgi:periplasmic protein TonB